MTQRVLLLQIFLGGLPYHFDEALCRQLLEPFGELQSFELVRDREKGDSKGYGFAVFTDRNVTETAIVGLNGLNIEGRVLTCRKYAAPSATGGHFYVIHIMRSGCPEGCCARDALLVSVRSAHCANHMHA
jgi:hypothetical protein